MDFWQVVAVILGSSAIAALVSGVVSMLVNRSNLRQQRDELDQQRLTETTRLMLDLMATAHGAPTDGRTGIGVGQQIAAIDMIVTIGLNNSRFYAAASSFLKDLADRSSLAASRGEQLATLQEAAQRGSGKLQAAT